MIDDECRHGMQTDWCADCRTGEHRSARVWITAGGSAYHRVQHCVWLAKGQRQADRQGLRTHEVQQVAIGSPHLNHREQCEHCFRGAESG